MELSSDDRSTGERIDRHAVSVLDLPAELRTLLQFFDADERPSALLDEYRTGSGRWRYENEAFEHLELAAEELETLLGTHDGHLRTIEPLQSYMDLRENGRIWRSTKLLSPGMRSLVCLRLSETDSLCGRASKATIGDGSSTPVDTNSDIIPVSMDWTRGPVSDMPPWIEYIRTFDWASTYLGPMDQWSGILRSYFYSTMMNPAPRILIWGDRYTFMYNEAASVLIGGKHPGSLGQPMQEIWAEIWAVLHPMMITAYGGRVAPAERMPLSITRTPGFLEETSWSFIFIPVMDDKGQIVGCLDELQELTHLVRGERRRSAIVHTSERIAKASSLTEIWKEFPKSLQSRVEDVPYALVYSIARNSPSDAPGEQAMLPTSISRCLLESTLGVDLDLADPCWSFSLSECLEKDPTIMGACYRAWTSKKNAVLHSRDGTLSGPFAESIPDRGFGDAVQTAIVSPILCVTGEVLGILILGLSPRSPWDDEYALFTNLIIDLLTKAVSLIALPEEQRRTQKVAANINTALAQQLQVTTLQAERSEAKFSRMAAASPVGMFVLDSTGLPTYVNDKYLELIGETREQRQIYTPTASSWNGIIHADDLDLFINTWNGLIESQAPVSIQYRLKKLTDAGTEYWLQANAFPELGPDGTVSSVMGWLTDISHVKISEELSSQRLEDALENKRRTENFLDMTSHEMRNPLSAILQSADWIVSILNVERGSLPLGITEELIDAAETVILCAQHQKRIVDDILTLSKLDASLLLISPDRVRPPMLISKALRMYEAEIARAGITVSLCIEPTYTELGLDSVLLDSSRLLQVIINLLTNAIKFTQYAETRTITIFLGASHEKPTGKHHEVNFIPLRQPRNLDETITDDDVYLQVAIQDTGQGLSDDEMKVLFERFSQGNTKTYKQYGGSGLGLFISRELCELQGGQIGVSSGGGKTTFTFFVKAKRAVADDATLLPTSSIDSEASLALGRRGSELLLGGLQPLDISVLSVGGDITEVIDSLAEKFVAANGKVIEETAAQGMHVLIVEDNIINQKILAKQLLRDPVVVQCHVANHGLEALTFLEKTIFCAAETPLSIILLDLEMPTMDGISCIRHIRAMQADGKISGHVPVIAVTANARPEQISAAIEAGMDQVVTKPFRIPELIPQMRTLVLEIAQRIGT